MAEFVIKDTNLKFSHPIVERPETKMIVIGDTEEISNYLETDIRNAADIHAYEESVEDDKPKMGIGFHYVITKDGVIEQGLPFYAKGHLVNRDDWRAIYIAVIGKFNEENPTVLQIENLAHLIARISKHYGITISKDFVFAKRELVSPSEDPGKNLFNMMDTIIGKANWYYNKDPKRTLSSKPIITKLSEHFDSTEFCCHGCDQGTCNCDYSMKINPILINLLEKLRENIGGTPLYINSGYRCPVHNAAVGGVANSQHVLGNAADIARPEHLKFEEFHWYINQLPFDGIGLYYNGDFIHVDVRDGGIGSKILFYGS